MRSFAIGLVLSVALLATAVLSGGSPDGTRDDGAEPRNDVVNAGSPGMVRW